MASEPRYVPGVFPLRAVGPIAKPMKGADKLERQESRAEIDKKEEKNKAIAKKKDGKCRLPFCPWCAAFDNQVHDGAHVLGAKGMGGDPSLEVSQPEHLMRLCRLSHASQEKHEWAVEPLTELGTRGVCEFYIVQDVYDLETQKFTATRVLWAREKAIGQPDAAAPYAKWDPIRRMKVQD